MKRLDPEMVEGLTVWGVDCAAQMRVVGEAAVLVLAPHTDPSRSPVETHTVGADNARALRDLLNIATARGLL